MLAKLRLGGPVDPASKVERVDPNALRDVADI
jgi:hypothetical protein